MASTRADVGGARPLAAVRGCLLIADISGYTDYVVESPLEYAEDVVSDLTATVAERLGHVLRVNKLQGDAVFAYALDGDFDSSVVLDVVDECYFAFRKRLAGMGHATACDCKACAKLPDLDLKFVLHHGAFVRRPGARGEELTGQDVILVHRLLKNGVVGATGVRAYALLSEAAVTAFGLEPAELGLTPHAEEYHDVGAVRAFVVDLGARFRAQEEERRVAVSPVDADFELETILPVPAPLAWEWLTSPPKRARWSDERVEEETAGGRRGAGTTAFCVDGRATMYEEILDWRPFEYFTERRSLGPSAAVVLTTSLEPKGGGTRVRTRVKRTGSRFAWLRSGPRLRRRLAASYDELARVVGSHRDRSV